MATFDTCSTRKFWNWGFSPSLARAVLTCDTYNSRFEEPTHQNLWLLLTTLYIWYATRFQPTYVMATLYISDGGQFNWKADDSKGYFEELSYPSTLPSQGDLVIIGTNQTNVALRKLSCEEKDWYWLTCRVFHASMKGLIV